MKILHIWNTAGIGSILCKYLKREGIIADCVTRKQYDKFGFADYYRDMIQYVKRDIQSAFDYLKIVNDELLKSAEKRHLKETDKDNAIAEKLLDAKVKVTEAIDLLAEANSIK